MKIKQTLSAALLTLGIISHVDAQNVVYVTGATAFRSTVYQALNTAGVVFDSGSTITRATRDGSSASGANYMLFRGLIGGTDTYINCAWSGSEAGIASVADVTIDNDGVPLPGSPQTWLKADGTVTGDASAKPTTGELEGSSRQGDLAFSDTSKAVSLTANAPLKDYGVVGIVPFTWVKNLNSSPTPAWSALTNITLPQINVLLANGALPASFFTGNAAHTNYVYLVGRNKGSGTRANQLANSGYGTSKAIKQFSIGGGVTSSQTDTLTLAYEGNNGYESGGSGLARALAVDGSVSATDPFNGNTGWIAVGFLGTSDALSKGHTTANWLAADGVKLTDGAVTSGQYYFWGNEHFYGRDGISGYQDNVGQKIYDGVKANIGTAGSVPTATSSAINPIYMQVEKLSDTAFPTPQ